MTPNTSTIRRIRQNHAIEHATVHTLSRWQPGIRLVGRSDWTGFWLYGDVETSLVERAARHGLDQLAGGNAASAIHPRCGTNMATTVLLASAGSWITARALRHSRFWGLLCGIAALWGTLRIAHPLGLLMQKHVTTTADMAGLRLHQVERVQQGTVAVHHVVTADTE